MNPVTPSLALFAVLVFGAHVSPQNDPTAGTKPDPKDELAATLKICGKPIDIEDDKPDKSGASRKILDYPGVALWFRQDKGTAEFYLHTAVRTRNPFVLDKNELIEALPCSRYVHYRRLRELE